METLKKGKYYVGDPCYIFSKSWDKVLNETNYFNEDGIIKVLGKECCVGGTAYGDGTYKDNFGREYNVDAGLLGVLPISLISKDKKCSIKEIEEDEGMHIIEFKEDFKVDAYNGIFHFGDIVIDTRSNDEDVYGEND